MVHEKKPVNQTEPLKQANRTKLWHAGVAAKRKPGDELATQLSVHYSMPRVEQGEAAEEAAEEGAEMDVEAEAEGAQQTKSAARRTQRLFHDDNLTSFFRRPAVSPDGRLVATAAGVQRDKTSRNTCFVWARDGLLGAPVLSLGGHAKPVVATRWAPCCFEPRADASGSEWVAGQGSGSRMMLAVATQNSVALYDSSMGARAVGLMTGLHYAAITDIAWSCDGAHLIIASIDGFASVAAIDQPTLPVATASRRDAADDVAEAVVVPVEQQTRDASALAAAEAAAAEAARLKGKKRLAPTFVSVL
ncbi:Chromatin assembly factor 1 subunit [Coemansia asiatica]|nr:Chromatin assembly factor 1 subunit [Coemansia asiatica]